ncbi:lecithin retinol acyltransferase family protein [Thiothrix lacustris]|uniref:Lecithin retinol acyltransferase family protein n=1 Tax=Thiothrix lacustris TaxID=525917 RepID=A0ABY9MRZ1_9GAMM|nr:lecithin retinol acyltransferase family protein [Thiothrix lacustris]WML91418.1 lecithin retinol acyltransferase family protein [Thiothrix lacustris]
MSALQPSIELETPEKPNIGDHLISSRLGYTHHGIYIGSGKVIHYSGLADGLASGAIEETTLVAFSRGREYSVKTYINPRFTGLIVAQRAKSRLGEDKYDVFSNNCEHFCGWCINDEHRSEQVDHAKSATTNGLVAFTVLRLITPPPIAIAASLGYGAYHLMQKNKTTQA